MPVDTLLMPMADAPRFLRIATWNLNHWQQPLLPDDTRRGAWQWLRNTAGAQVALVQEAVPPDDLTQGRAAYGEMAGWRNWGSAVVALDPAIAIEPLRSVRTPWSRRRYLLANTNPGSVAVARLTVPGIQDITLVSVYGVLDGSAVSTMLRIVADLVPLFDSPDGSRVILGGDLNVSRASSDPRHVARAEAVIDAIGALGLAEAKTLVQERPASSPDCRCGQAAGCDHIATWGRDELDHLFVSPSLAGQVKSLSVDTGAVAAGLSDHAPLVLDLALSAERTPHVWDEESFAEEVGRRHGPGARAVVERLVSWAEHKERELTTQVGVTTKVFTRFPTNGVTTEPELLFPVDLNLEPRGSQVMLSVHADGRVVVWLGALRHPPFDTEEARHGLRVALDGMDGVDIPAGLVNGWPRFPISVLEDPANLSKLVAVLDRVATETHAGPPVADVAPGADTQAGRTIQSVEPATVGVT